MLGLYNHRLYWYTQPVLLILALGLLTALIVGLLLLVRPGTVLALNTRLSRWVSTAEAFARLDQPVTWERFFYRHHRLLGALITLGAAYVLLRWAFDFQRAELLSLLGRRWTANGLDSLVLAGEWIVVGLHVLLLIVGLVILFRPSQLKVLEQSANRWMTPAAGARLDTVIESVDRSVAVYPRLSGLLVVVASAWCLVRLYPAFALAFAH